MTVKVTVTKGVTAGVGNFESIRVEATASFDVEGNMWKSQEVADAYSKAYSFLDEVLNEQINEIQPILKRDSVFKSGAEKSSAPKRRSKHGS